MTDTLIVYCQYVFIIYLFDSPILTRQREMTDFMKKFKTDKYSVPPQNQLELNEHICWNDHELENWGVEEQKPRTETIYSNYEAHGSRVVWYIYIYIYIYIKF